MSKPIGYKGPKSKVRDEDILDLMRQGLHNAEICRRLSMDQTAANPKLKRLREENGLVRFKRGDVVKSDTGLYEIINSCANDFTIRNAEGQNWVIPWTRAKEFKVIGGSLIDADIPGPDYRIEGVSTKPERVIEPKQVMNYDHEPAEAMRPTPKQEPTAEPEPLPEPMIDVEFVLDQLSGNTEEVPQSDEMFRIMRIGIAGYLGSLIVEGKPLKPRYVEFYNELTQEVNE